MTTKLILDSGAYSAFTQKKKIDLDEYISYVKKNEKYLEVYFNLDVLGNGSKSYINWVYMRTAGLNPVPVFHITNDLRDLRFLERYIAQTDYVAIGAIANMSTSKRMESLDRVWKDHLTDKDGMPKLKVHGFGLTSIRVMRTFPWYCMTEENHQVLTKKGWKYLYGLKIGDEILTFNNKRSQWEQIQEIPIFEVKNEKIYHLLNRNFEAYITGNHRWLTTDSQRPLKGKEYRWKSTTGLNSHDCIDRAALFNFPKKEILTDEQVGLLAWYWTDGSHSIRPKCKNDSVVIWQSEKANPEKCEIIRNLLVSSGEKFCESKSHGIIQFEFYGEISKWILSFAPYKKLPIDLPLMLTRHQAQMFVDYSVLADGTKTAIKKRKCFEITVKRFVKKKNLKILRTICLLLGIPTSVFSNKNGYESLRSSPIDYIYIGTTKEKTINYTGRLWCVKVPSGAFFTKCNGKIYVTGNSVDSTSWVMFGRYGAILVPKTKNGKYTYDDNPFIVTVSSKSPKQKDLGKHFNTFSSGVQEKILKYIEDMGFDMGEEGLPNVHYLRDQINMLYYLGVQDSMPKWPWAFKTKQRIGEL
jgi:hypothetical protein